MENQIYNQHTVPFSPLLEMPSGPQDVFLALLSVTTIILLVNGVVMITKHRTWLPLLFVMGGFCTILLEPMGDLLGHAVHPQIGQINQFEALDRMIPWHIGLLYAVGFGLPLQLMYSRMAAGRLTSGFMWKAFCFLFMGLYAVEIIPIHYGLWGYFGKQALWVWKGSLPISWIFANTTVNIVPATMIYLFMDQLKGFKQLLVIPIILVGAVGAWTGVGAPFLVAINSNAVPWLVQTSGILTVLLAFFVTAMCALLCEREMSAETYLENF